MVGRHNDPAFLLANDAQTLGYGPQTLVLSCQSFYPPPERVHVFCHRQEVVKCPGTLEFSAMNFHTTGDILIVCVSLSFHGVLPGVCEFTLSRLQH